MKKKRLFLIGLSLAGMAVWRGVYRRYQQEIKAMEARLAAQSNVLATAVGPVEYAVRGTGIPLLVSHGALGGYDQCLAVGDLLGDDFQIVGVSRFGYLRSPLPAQATPADQADAFVAVLDALNLERVLIVGASAGGPTAVQFALRYPHRCAALVLGSSITSAFTPPPFAMAFSHLILRANFLFWVLLRVFPKGMMRTMGISREILAHMSPQEYTWLLGLLDTLLPVHSRKEGTLNDIQQIAHLPIYPLDQITMPTFIVHAQDDPIAPFAYAERSHAAIPGSKLIALPSGGHFGSSQPAQFAQIAAFLREVFRA